MSKPYVSKERANQPVIASSLYAAIEHGRKRRETQLQAKTVAYLAIAKSLMIDITMKKQAVAGFHFGINQFKSL